MDLSPRIIDILHANNPKPDNKLNIRMPQLSQSLTQAYQAQPRSPYLNLLPAEVRNEVYKYLLVSPLTITPEHQAVGPLRHCAKSSTRSAPALDIDATLLRACKAIAYEGYPVLYGQNTFSFASPTEMRYFKPDGFERGRGRSLPLTKPSRMFRAPKLIANADYRTAKANAFGFNSLAGSLAGLGERLSLMRRVKLDMAMDFFHPGFGEMRLAHCWRRMLDRNRTHPHLKSPLTLDTLPYLDCLPRLEYLYLDFSGLMALYNEEYHAVSHVQ